MAPRRSFRGPFRTLLLAGILACGPGGPRRDPHVPPAADGKKNVVRLVLDGAVPERGAPAMFGDATSRSLFEWTRLLDDVRRDGDVAAIFLELRTVGCGWACTEELAAAFEAVRGSGRKVLCVAEDLEDREYLFALRACDGIVMEPGATLWLDGLALHEVFLREALGGIGLEADVLQIGRYKGAAEPLVRDSMSDELREELGQLLDHRFGAVVAGVSAARRLAPEAVRTVIDSGPFTAPEALAAGLVDEVAFSDRVRSRARREAGGRVVDEYDRERREHAEAEDVAEVFRALAGQRARPRLGEPSLVVVYASGPIARSSTEIEGILGEGGVSADSLVPLLEDLGRDDNVKAVVLRIDSPGGSALASDLLWRALRLLDRRKPVVASLGDVAASGGYYLASGTRRIFANPSTITGSIGVVGGKLATRGLLQKIHVNEETLQRGANAAALSGSDRFTESERSRILALMRQTYRDFVGRVARGRGMTHAEVRALAEGRIYTGTRAKEVGLVDETGTLEDAIAWARKAGHLEEDAPIVRLPALGGLLDALLGASARHVAARQGPLGSALPLSLSSTATLRQVLGAARLFAEEPVLALMPFGVEVQ